LEQIDNALAVGMRKHAVLADSGYGDAREFRDALSERKLQYLVEVRDVNRVWPPGMKPTIRKRKGGRLIVERPTRIAETVAALDPCAWRNIRWREGPRSRASRFAAVRVQTAEHWEHGWPASEPVWLVVEWPKDEAQPTKHWISNLPATVSPKTLVHLAKLRWRIERDYQEMKQEIGLDHFEGRTWRGFHHHTALCAVAHGFLALRRALFPPKQTAVDAA
jgi:SRSO17 transposase